MHYYHNPQLHNVHLTLEEALNLRHILMNM